jgi:Mce-associated membrane protein
VTRIRLPSPRRAVRSRWFPWVVAGSATAAAIVFGVLWLGLRAEAARRAEVETTTRSFLMALTNFSGETIDRDVAEIRSHAIGQFAEEVQETFSPDRIAAIRDNQATSVGRVRSVFVEHLDAASAAVFGVVDETVTNAAQPAPRMDVLRIEVSLIDTAQGWKVDRVEILQSPGGLELG